MVPLSLLVFVKYCISIRAVSLQSASDSKSRDSSDSRGLRLKRVKLKFRRGSMNGSERSFTQAIKGPLMLF